MPKKHRKFLYHVKYQHGEGFAVSVVPKAPPSARTKADVICVTTFKRTQRGPNKGKLHGFSNYYTPDEAMSIGIGLIKAVDMVMDEHYAHFRKHKDTSV